MHSSGSLGDCSEGASPPSPGIGPMRSWVIGSNAQCDVVVNSPLASGRHCQLTQDSDGLILADLGSTNGTYVDGNRITAATRITPAQEITIGQTMPMPWPAELVKFVRIGRVPGNDIVLDDPRVSSRHARLMIVGGSEALIEDLGSSNGTFLNSVDTRVTRLTPISRFDTLYFGSMAVPASRLLAGLLGTPYQYRPPPARLPRASEAPTPATSRRCLLSGGFIEANRWLLAGLVQAPVLAFLIVVLSGRQAAAAVTEANGRIGRSSDHRHDLRCRHCSGLARVLVCRGGACRWRMARPPAGSQRGSDLGLARIASRRSCLSACALASHCCWPSFTGGQGSKVRGYRCGPRW